MPILTLLEGKNLDFVVRTMLLFLTTPDYPLWGHNVPRLLRLPSGP